MDVGFTRWKGFPQAKSGKEGSPGKAQANAHSLKKNKQIYELINMRRVQGVVSRMFGMLDTKRTEGQKGSFIQCFPQIFIKNLQGY